MKKFLTLLCSMSTLMLSAQDIALTQVTPLEYLRPNTQHPFHFVVSNTGGSMVAYSAIQCHWQWNNGPVQSATPQSTTTWIPANTFVVLNSTDFVAQVPNSTTQHQFKAWITVAGDPNPANDTLTMMSQVLHYIPQKNVVLYTFKHQACGPCYPADTFLQNEVGQQDNHILVNVYTGANDICRSNDSEVLEDEFGSSTHPTSSIDMFTFPDGNYLQSYYTLNNTMYLENLGQREHYLQPVGTQFSQLYVDSTSGNLIAVLDVKFEHAIPGDIRINAYLLEDSVQGYQAGAPDPNNYYHRNVFRKAFGGARGFAAFPSPVMTSGMYSVTIIFFGALTKYDVNKLKIVGLVQKHPSALQNGEVLNATILDVGDYLNPTSTQHPLAQQPRIYPNPSKDRIHITGTDTHDPISYTISDLLGRRLYSGQLETNSSIDISALSPGLYMLSLIAGDQMYNSKIEKQ